MEVVPKWDISCMRIITETTLREYQERYPKAEKALTLWRKNVQKAHWLTPQDIKNNYRSASFVGNNRVIFNINGNDFRLIVAVSYRFQALYIKFFGTHAEYDKIQADIVEVK